MDNNQISPETKTRFNLVEFVRETRREVGKITWPTRKETIVTTTMIVVMALVVGVFYFGVDSVIGMIIGRILSMKG